jgi:2-polyprenyl-6-methoxyphenol hydroxylase-like FAD-dependent oxidoreductase
MLAYLLARKGIAVTLLEGAADFKREFRGDTLQPAVLEALEQLGLADALHALPHIKAPSFRYHTSEGPFAIYDLREIRTRFPYIMLIHQPAFLQFMIEQARTFSGFELRMESRVEGLIEEQGAVRGVRYRQNGQLHELRAELTIGADGRFSKVRQLANPEIVRLSPGADVLWFRLPRTASDPASAETEIFLGDRNYVAMLERDDHWQVGYSIGKGEFKAVKERGLEPIRTFVRDRIPWLADRVDQLQDWKQVTLLNVEILRAKRWYKPGLLLLGDAAHVISPTGGLGINVAVQDAIAAANILTAPLLEHRLTTADLAAVQQRRGWKVALIQLIQAQIERGNSKAFQLARGSQPPAVLKVLRSLPWLKQAPGRLTAYGVRPERLSAAWLQLDDRRAVAA